MHAESPGTCALMLHADPVSHYGVDEFDRGVPDGALRATHALPSPTAGVGHPAAAHRQLSEGRSEHFACFSSV